MNFEPRQLVEVLYDLYRNTYLMWQPLVAALLVRLITSGLASGTAPSHYQSIVRPVSWTHRFFAALNWVATWLLVGIILTIVSISVRY
jgi:uncharacterized membrane protein